MLNQQTLEKLNEMKLFGMAKGFEELIQKPRSDLPFEQAVGIVSDREYIYRQNKRLERLLKRAKFKKNACVEDIDYHSSRGFNKKQILNLTSCDWITHHHNIIISGPTGAGKSYLAEAFGHKACREGFTVLYFRAPRLFIHIHQARNLGTYLKELQKLSKAHVLIIDDFALAPMTDFERRDLLEILDDRSQTSSTIITSQLSPDKWHALIGDETIADAICDRLLHNAHRIKLKGDTRRLEEIKT
jgi:DNA replication protein DnaC